MCARNMCAKCGAWVSKSPTLRALVSRLRGCGAVGGFAGVRAACSRKGGACVSCAWVSKQPPYELSRGAGRRERWRGVSEGEG